MAVQLNALLTLALDRIISHRLRGNPRGGVGPSEAVGADGCRWDYRTAISRSHTHTENIKISSRVF